MVCVCRVTEHCLQRLLELRHWCLLVRGKSKMSPTILKKVKKEIERIMILRSLTDVKVHDSRQLCRKIATNKWSSLWTLYHMGLSVVLGAGRISTSQHLSGSWESSPKDHQEVKVLFTPKNKESICAHSGAQQWIWISGPSLEHSSGLPQKASEGWGRISNLSLPSFFTKLLEWKAFWKLKPLLKIPFSPNPALNQTENPLTQKPEERTSPICPWSYQDSHHFESQSLEAAAHGPLLQAAIQALLRVPGRQLWKKKGVWETEWVPGHSLKPCFLNRDPDQAGRPRAPLWVS